MDYSSVPNYLIIDLEIGGTWLITEQITQPKHRLNATPAFPCRFPSQAGLASVTVAICYLSTSKPVLLLVNSLDIYC